MTDAIKPIKRKGRKITKPADALAELQGMKVPEEVFSGEADIDEEMHEVIDRKVMLILKDIRCVDAYDNVFESYEYIKVFKDFERFSPDDPDRTKAGQPRPFTPYRAISYFENRGDNSFLPSFALSCNILAKLFKAGVKRLPDGSYEVIDELAESILQQYTTSGVLDFRYHQQNTLIDWKNRQVIHYPQDGHFPEQRQQCNVNQWRPFRKSFDFLNMDFNSPAGAFRDLLLENALGYSSDQSIFIRNLTGLNYPRVLVEIGEYLNRPAYAKVLRKLTAKCERTSPALSSSSQYLLMDVDRGMSSEGYARGVCGLNSEDLKFLRERDISSDENKNKLKAALEKAISAESSGIYK